MQFIIYAPPYNENAGGCIVLHRLCHLLNEQKHNAYLDLYISKPPKLDGSQNTKIWAILRYIKHYTKYLKNCVKIFSKQGINKEWNTKKISKLKKLLNPHLKNYIVVYPEVTIGNPLKAKNVVRLIMHNPGYFTNGKTEWGTGELLFRYSDSFARDYIPNPGSKLSKELITISTTPKCYNTDNVSEKRTGTAYLMRKGKNKKIVHDLTDSIKIDGLSHQECAQIFKRVKTFISYDAVTAYSGFAVRCGCRSIIILGDDETPETYRPTEESRCYVDFGLGESKVDMQKAIQYLNDCDAKRESKSKESAEKFVSECKKWFEEPRAQISTIVGGGYNRLVFYKNNARAPLFGQRRAA